MSQKENPDSAAARQETSIESLVSTASEAARAGGIVLRQWFGAEDLEVSLKGENDLVSQADRESEAAVVGVITSRFPEHRILAEEGGILGGASELYQWILDPLDGTSNFVHGLPIFCVSVACRRGDDLLAAAVYEPVADRMFLAGRGRGATLNGRAIEVTKRQGLTGAFLSTGFPFRAHHVLDAYMKMFRFSLERARGMRRCGAAALDLANTAAGIYDAFFEVGLSPWDVAAGALLIREAGGVVTDFDGSQGFLASGNIIGGAAGVQQELRQAFESLISPDQLASVAPQMAGRPWGEDG